MISPYESETLNPLYVADDAERNRLLEAGEAMPSLVLASTAAANAAMLGAGYFNPLSGYMNLADALAVAENMHMGSGLFWPVPILHMTTGDKVTDEFRTTGQIALRDPNVEGNPILAIQEVNAIEEMAAEQIETIVSHVFRTTDQEHPGVAAFKAAGNMLISGPIQVLSHSYFRTDFPNTYRTAPEIRQLIQDMGWNTVAAFQTRNPMHLAHEELCRMAQKATGRRSSRILVARRRSDRSDERVVGGRRPPAGRSRSPAGVPPCVRNGRLLV